MFKKIIFLFVIFTFWLSCLIVEAQQSQPVAKVRDKVIGFKNPSHFKGRLGLVCFSSDDKRLAFVGENNTLMIYDLAAEKVLRQFKMERNGANGFAFGENNQTALIQDFLLTKIDVWDLESAKTLHQIEGRNSLSGMKRMLLASNEQKLTGLEMKDLPLSPDKKNLLVSKTDGIYQVVDVETGKMRFELKQFNQPSGTKDFLKMLFVPFASISPTFFYVSNASYNADGNRIALANGDNIPTLWDAETGKLIAKLEPQIGKVYSAIFSSGGKLVATTDVTGITKIWDAQTGAIIATIGTPNKREFALSWSPTAELLATFAENDEIHFYEARSGKLLTKIENAKIRRILFSPDGNLIASIASDDKSKLGQIWSVKDGHLIATLPRQKKEEHALSIDWNPDGNMFVVASENYVKIYSNGGELLQTLETAVFPARFSHDGKLLATGGKNDVGFIWQIGE